MDNYLKKMFIDQAKPAMKRHSGSGSSGGGIIEVDVLPSPTILDPNNSGPVPSTVYEVDENGETYVVPEDEVLPAERLYMQNCSTPETTADELNARFVSVPVDPSYEIVSVGNNTEVA